MGQISLSLPADGTTIEASDVNNPLNTILNEFNGNIDDNNIKTAANINAAKLNSNTLPPTIFDANSRAGWLTGILPAPNTVTPLGNRSYSLVFNSTDLTSYISAGMRLRTTRTAAAPNQCTSLNGSSQYYSKSSPSGMTFTDDFVVSAWVKLNSYPVSEATIASRYNGTSGWSFKITSTGQVFLTGQNAGAGNYSQVGSYQSVPLGKWVHVTAQLDMSTFTATTTTSYVMFDGVDVPATVARAGTNPTALIQAGNLEIGSTNGGSQFFNGKIAQVAIYSAKITQATILTAMHQTLSGSETSLVSAYSFNNTINDLNTTNTNNLSAQASAVATNADSPYGGQEDGTISTTLDYAIVTKTAFSTNTTLTVQVAEGCTVPASGGVTAVAYSEQRSPYLFPSQKTKWRVFAKYKGGASQTINNTTAQISGAQFTLPNGEWVLGHSGHPITTSGGVTFESAILGLSTSTSSFTDDLDETRVCSPTISSSTTQSDGSIVARQDYAVSGNTTIYLLGKTTANLGVIWGYSVDIIPGYIFAECAYL
jgi:hypothetical protein